jgi:putative RecB family exonuclease
MPLYSHSRISAFESCPLKYRLRYVDKIRTRVNTVEAFLGSRVHETLERLYRDRKKGVVPKLPDLIAYFMGAWRRKWHREVRIVRAHRTVEQYQSAGRSCISDYYSRFVPFDQSETLSLEHRVLLTLDDAGRYKMQGYIDRLARGSDGVVEIHDYKTSESLPSQESLDRDRQLALYQIGIQQRQPEVEDVVLIWHFLRHGETRTSRRTPEDLRGLAEETVARIREIQSVEEFPARESRLCAWCEYAQTCPAWEGRPLPWQT